LPADVERALRSHVNEVDATLELAEIERRKLVEVMDRGDSTKQALAGYAVMSFLGGLVSFIYFASKSDSRGVLWSVGFVVLGMILLGVVQLVRRRAEVPPVPAGAVACNACGAHTPIEVTAHAVSCVFCGTEIMLSAAARRRALEVADRELAFARAQRLAMEDEPKD